MRHEKWPTEGRPEWQLEFVVGLAAAEFGTANESLMVYVRFDGVRRWARRKGIGHKALISARDRKVHRPTVFWGPMPIEVFSAACEPVPLDLLANRGHAFSQTLLTVPSLVKIFSCANEALHQQRGLNNVTAVILAGEGNGFSRSAVEKVCKHAVISLTLIQKTQNGQDAVERLIPRYPSPLNGDDDGHDAKACSASTDNIVVGFACRLLAIAG